MPCRVKKNAFTLVELLISISIIAILSVILSISFSKAQKNARDQRRIEDLKAVQTAAEQYYLLSGSYPASNLYGANDTWTVSGQVVLQSFPKDPKDTEYLVDSAAIANGGYCLCAALEKEGSDSANADWAGSNCDWFNVGDYYCVRNQQ